MPNQLRRHPVGSSRPAFTLVEVLIVVLFIAILAAMTVQSIEADIPDRLNAACEIMIADIDQIRELAIVNNTQYQIEFFKSTNTIVVRHSGPNSTFDVLPVSPFMVANNLGTELSYVVGSSGIGIAPELVLVEDPADNEFTTVDFGTLGETVTRSVVTRIWFGCGDGDRRRYKNVDINPITGLAKVGELQVTSPE
ncbi:MAG: type II secretory pathway pseudopilin PulG [Pirellulaceae bacterium]|jgi:type II secretory pathway pseudopilin PulG